MKDRKNEENQNTTAPKKKTKKHRWVRRLIVTVILLAILAGGGYLGYMQLKSDYTTVYTPYTATIGSISNSLSISANVSVVDSSTVTASSDATVRSIRVKEGDKVKKDDVLIKLSTGTVKAENDGTVNRIYVSEGDDVSAGTNLAQVADLEHMRISMRVDEYDIGKLSVGDTCNITTTATEKTFQSTISSIDYISNSSGNVAYYTALCDLNVTDADGVYPGMQVTVSIPQESAENVVVLREDALSFDRTNSAFVYMKNENDEMVEQKVTVGVSNGNYVEIKEGLKDGDTVYVVVEQETSSGIASLLSGAFGTTQVMGGGGAPSGFSGGDMPSFGGSGGSGSGSFSPPSGFSGGGSGSGGGFGGGR